jgi:Transposase, Mutator family
MPLQLVGLGGLDNSQALCAPVRPVQLISPSSRNLLRQACSRRRGKVRQFGAKAAFDPNTLLDEPKKAFAERALNAEMDNHLTTGEPGNSRNGYDRKSVTTDSGRIELEIPRDRQSSFHPQLIAHRRISAALSGFRRKDHFHVYPWHERAGDRRAFARSISR